MSRAGVREVAARIGALGVYATAAELRATQRTRSERLTLTLLTLVGSWILAPLAFLIPPHLESGAIAFLAGIYFARRAWVGEWQVASMSGACPRCDGALTIKSGTMLYLPHTLHCPGCSVELWLELGSAPEIDDVMRQSAREQLGERPGHELGGRPPLTWSPAASDWRDRR
ncbi:hypothetical protein BH23GEM9_BH23GEM9_28640 [soil metagenome]